MKKVLLVLLMSNVSMASTKVIEDIRRLEDKFSIPKFSLVSIIKMESGFRADQINPTTKKYSYGLGQLTRETAMSHCKLSMEKIMGYRENLLCSAKVLKYQLLRYNNDLNKAVVAYNQGTPCICNGEFFTKEYGRTVIFCKKTVNKVKEKISCVEKGVLLETEYLALFRKNINLYL